MQYFANENKRKASGSSCYLEFQKGHFSGKHWLSDSICIEADLWDEHHLSDVFTSVIRYFDSCGVNEITKTQWEQILLRSREWDSLAYAILQEAATWVNACFQEHDVLTIASI